MFIFGKGQIDQKNPFSHFKQVNSYASHCIHNVNNIKNMVL
jgi:hypothetical protein